MKLGFHRTVYNRILAILLSVLILACALPVTAFADSKQTEEQLNAAKEAAGQTQQAIDENQDNIDSLNDTKDVLSGQLNSLTGQLNSLNANLSEVADNLADIESRIDSKNAEIEETTAELDAAQQTADEQYASMKKRIQFMYEKGNTTYLLELLLGSKTFGEMLNRAAYIDDLESYDRKMLEQYRETAKEVAEKKAELEQEESELEDLKAQAEAEQARVSSLVSETQSNINSTEGGISQYAAAIDGAEAQADALEAQLDQQNENIEVLEKQLAEERRLEALSRASVWRSIGDVTFSDDDRYLLANLIYCEAGAEPYEGKLAVGAVVINRVLSGAFPSTVVGVIYQSGQFAPVSDGHLAIALAANKATDACYQAADEAMAGQTNVADCIFFRTPIPQVTPKYTIGGHIFY